MDDRAEDVRDRDIRAAATGRHGDAPHLFGLHACREHGVAEQALRDAEAVDNPSKSLSEKLTGDPEDDETAHDARPGEALLRELARFEEGPAGAPETQERDAEPDDEHRTFETRKRSVEAEEEQRKRGGGGPCQSGRRKSRSKGRDQGRGAGHPEGEEGRSAEERSRSCVREPVQVGRDPGGEVLDLEAREDNRECECRNAEPSPRREDSLEEELGTGHDEEHSGCEHGETHERGHRPYRYRQMAGDYPTVLDLVGSTPLVRLQRLTRDVQPTLLAKLEYLNPGGSVKDRIGLRMIEQAERDGKLQPGGTIVEPTSGNTGVGLAIAAALKGYRCVFVMPDKIAEEKRALLRAYGAEVVICPTAVPPESPESYYSVSNRLAEEIPGAFKPDQYSNQANPQAHYETTGPELWEQTGGQIDALVLSIGTGGTVTGTARYLKEQKPDLLVVGADPEGSIFSNPDNVHPYLVEGIGEDFWPTTFDPSLVDEFITVSDRDSFRTARRLAREEGILVGGSGGTAVWAMLQVADRFGPDATLVTIIPDSGRGYLSKVYDDNWLLEHGFLERSAPAATIQAVLTYKRDEEPEVPELVTVATHQKVGEAIDLMQRYGISQLPVVRNGDEAASLADVVGSIRESGLLDRVFRNQDALSEDIAAAMEPPLPAVEIGASVDTVFADLSAGNPAVVVARSGRPVGVLTRADLLEYLAHQQSQA